MRSSQVWGFPFGKRGPSLNRAGGKGVTVPVPTGSPCPLERLKEEGSGGRRPFLARNESAFQSPRESSTVSLMGTLALQWDGTGRWVPSPFGPNRGGGTPYLCQGKLPGAGEVHLVGAHTSRSFQCLSDFRHWDSYSSLRWKADASSHCLGN